MRKIGIFLVTASLSFAAPIDDAKSQTYEEFNTYAQNEMKAFKSYSLTLDGIENRVNPYQKQPLLSTPLSPVPTKDDLLIKKTNLLPENTPSGSQIEAVKKTQTPLNELIAPVAPRLSSTVTKDEVKFDFFGTPLVMDRSLVAFTSSLTPRMNDEEIMQRLQRDGVPLSREIASLQKRYQLNDWDSFVCAQLVVNTLYGKENLRVKTLHFSMILKDLGFKVLMVYGEDKNAYILIPSKQMIYAKPFYEKFGEKYFLFKVDEHPRSTASTGIYFPEMLEEPQGRAFDMVMKKDPLLGEDMQKVKLSWDFRSKNYSCVVGVNKNLLALQDMYPQVEVESYMESKAGEKTKQELASALKAMIDKEHLSAQESGQFILRFGQKAFAYKTDFDAYGYERPFFLEQTLALPYSDCEDRAILLSHLYTLIMKVPSVGLQYSGHIALGVAFENQESGDYYLVDQKRYFVADGTYFYAPVGVSQPEFKGKKAKVIKIKS